MNYTGLKKLSSPYIEAADINYDGQITTVDLSQLKMLLVGLGLPTDDSTSTDQSAFDFNYVHKISNYIDMSGIAPTDQAGVAGYQFSYDNGKTWYPQVPQSSLDYTLVNVPADSTANLKIKTIYTVGNSTTTASKTQRTFTTGIKLLKDNIGAGAIVDETNNTITLPNGKVYELAVTSNGSYDIFPLTVNGQANIDPTAVDKINSAILKFEQSGVKSTEDVLNELQTEGFGTVNVDTGTLIVDEPESYVTYVVVEIAGGKHEARFSSVAIKTVQTASAQAAEQVTLQQVSDFLKTKKLTDKISDILNGLVTNGIIQDGNINTARGTFETETGMVYQLALNSDNTGYSFNVLNLAEIQNDQLIVLKMLDIIRQGIINQIIDWEILDGITTESSTDRRNGVFETKDGTYKLVTVNILDGTYSITDTTPANGSYIQFDYTLSPDFPTMTDKTTLTINSVGGTGTAGIAKIQVFSEIGDTIYEKDYDPTTTQTTTDTMDLTNNGMYFITATDGNGIMTAYTVMVVNIITMDPIKVSVDPGTPRNTTKTGTQNGVDTGPITVTLKYGEAAILKNTDKYQYQIVPYGGTISDTSWVTVPVADRQAVITGIVNNCTIYARYYDGKNSLKQVKVDVNNVDNVAPDPFGFTTIITSHSITVNAMASDTAADSNGNPSGNGVAGVTGYLYQIVPEGGTISDTAWVSNGDWTNDDLTQGSTYQVYVKAVDGAGNETLATNSGQSVKLLTVPDAGGPNGILTVHCDPSSITKDTVTATFGVKDVSGTAIEDLPNGINPDGTLNNNYVIQCQIAPAGTKDADPNGEWDIGSSYTTPTNCVIFLRVADLAGQAGDPSGYLREEINNIDNVGPNVTLKVADPDNDITKTSIKVTVDAEDTDGGIGAATSGIDKYEYSIVGTILPLTTSEDTTENTYTFTGLEEGRTYSIYVTVIDKAGNRTQSETMTVPTAGEPMDETNKYALGIGGKFNDESAPQTVNGADPNYYNPPVPAGFRAINTDDAKWNGTGMAQDFYKGLVIEANDGTKDVNSPGGQVLGTGSEFVWVPVDGNSIVYAKGDRATPSTDDLPTALKDLGIEEQQQILDYGGFYVSRYEAGNDDGTLASKQGLKPENGVTYDEAKAYAEGMYTTTPTVRSGLLTGTAWDTMVSWIAQTSNSGSDYVTNNQANGNNINSSFQVNGWYAVGPNDTGEKREAWVQGSYTKQAGQACLIGTGLVDAFKMNNIYDLAGNVWEYTYETMQDGNGNDMRVARGGDYFTHISATDQSGAEVAYLIPMDSDKQDRNESGFRVMLYLTQGAPSINNYVDYNTTMNGKASAYNNPVIPAGFAPLNTGADWSLDSKGAVTGWNDGLVIGDKAGNEFVWVPVNVTDVSYTKWIERGESYTGTTDDALPAKVTGWNDIPDNIKQLITAGELTVEEYYSSVKYGGFYIARYETSKDMTSGTAVAASKSGVASWTNINYTDAKAAAENVSEKQYVSVGLITGTQWDTVMQWIATIPSIWTNGIINDSTSWGDYSNSTLGASAQAKNIFGLAGGNWEWTTEKNASGQVAYRGGVSTDRGDSSPAGYRGFKDGSTLDSGTTFRMVLYITGDIKGSTKKPVEEKPALLATFANLTSHYLWTSDSYGTVYVGPYFSGLASMKFTNGKPVWPNLNETFDEDKNGLCVLILRKEQPVLITQNYFMWWLHSDSDPVFSNRTIQIDEDSVTFTSGNSTKTALVIGNTAQKASDAICPIKKETGFIQRYANFMGDISGINSISNALGIDMPDWATLWLTGGFGGFGIPFGYDDDEGIVVQKWVMLLAFNFNFELNTNSFENLSMSALTGAVVGGIIGGLTTGSWRRSFGWCGLGSFIISSKL